MDLKSENELNIEGEVIKTELPEISSNTSEAQINFNEEIQNKDSMDIINGSSEKYQCDFCEKKFAAKVKLKAHITSNHRNSIECERCKKVFKQVKRSCQNCS